MLLLRLLLLRSLLFTWYRATQGIMFPTFLTGLSISVNLIKITLQIYVLSVDCYRLFKLTLGFNQCTEHPYRELPAYITLAVIRLLQVVKASVS